MRTSKPPTGRPRDAIPSKTASHLRVNRHFYPAKNYNCVDCGKPAREYDHYKGYGKNWDKVQPVCRSCHLLREYRRGVRKPPIILCPHGNLGIRYCRECHNEDNRRRYWRKKHHRTR